MNNAHDEHRIHSHSRAAYAEFDKMTRKEQVLLAYQALGTATDREVRDWCGYQEMNAVRPAITSMVETGELVEQSSTRCETTGRPVRLCRKCIGQPIPIGRQSKAERAAELIREVRVYLADQGGYIVQRAMLTQAIHELLGDDDGL